jgi:hypothetical protein
MEGAENPVHFTLAIVEHVRFLGLLEAASEQRRILIEERPLKHRAGRSRTCIANPSFPRR